MAEMGVAETEVAETGVSERLHRDPLQARSLESGVSGS
ncbi:hypothetical protein BH09PSE3_BH09PSE3_10310 [soil metagenome]